MKLVCAAMSDWLRPLIPATREQVLRGLVSRWRMRVSNPSGVIDANSLLSGGFTPFDLAEIDLADLNHFFDRFGSETATRAVMARLRQWAESGDEPTFGEISELIAAHVNTIDARPLLVLGRSCASAGEFLALRTVAHECDPRALVSPGDSIRQVLGRGGARRFLERCQSRLLAAQSHCGFLARAREFALTFGAFCVLIGIAFMCGWPDVGIAWSGLATASYLAAWTASALDDGLPEGVKTFRDLAERNTLGRGC